MRGNVQTRLAKLEAGEYSALVLAAAGLKRLGLEDRIHRYFSAEEMIPAAGQGILAVQTRRGMDLSFLAAVADEEATVCALAERAFVRELAGGCSSPVAAHAVVEQGTVTLTGLYVSPDETVIRRGRIAGPKEEAERMGQTLARQLKEGE